jgi:hypothetical protein
MDLKPVLFKYNLHVCVYNNSWFFYLKGDADWSDWSYIGLGKVLGRLSRDELLSMSAEELEEFAVGCSIRSMCPEC